MTDGVGRALRQAVSATRGHFRYESGHHGDLWLDLDSLFLDAARMRGWAEALEHGNVATRGLPALHRGNAAGAAAAGRAIVRGHTGGEMLVSPRRFVGALALVLVVMSGTAAAQSTRTPFDRLALDSPEAAVARFVDAYRQRDYVTVYWILSPAAQKAWTDDFYAFNMEPLIAKLPDGRASEIMRTAFPPMDQWDQTDVSWVFDRVMVSAGAAGALPVQMPQDGAAGKPQPRADGAVTIGFGQGAAAVKFRLVRAPSGQWRVFSVSAGGNPDRAPWGLGKTD